MAYEKNGSYEVGYGKAPRHSVFKKGHAYYPPYSRKPKKEATQRSGRASIATVLDKQLRANIDRRVRRISRYRALILKEMNAALKGDVDALLRMVKRAKRFGFFDRPPSTQQSGVVVVYKTAGMPTKEEWLEAAREWEKAQSVEGAG